MSSVAGTRLEYSLGQSVNLLVHGADLPFGRILQAIETINGAPEIVDLRLLKDAPESDLVSVMNRRALTGGPLTVLFGETLSHAAIAFIQNLVLNSTAPKSKAHTSLKLVVLINGNRLPSAFDGYFDTRLTGAGAFVAFETRLQETGGAE